MLDAGGVKEELDALAARDTDVKRWLKRIGYPQPRVRERGFNALVRALIGQQVSIAAAASIYQKLEKAVGDLHDARVLHAASDDVLRSGGLSRQKVGYARSLADAVVSGALDFSAMPQLSDDDAIAAISAVKGFGRWSAEIYLMFAETFFRRMIWACRRDCVGCCRCAIAPMKKRRAALAKCTPRTAARSRCSRGTSTRRRRRAMHERPHL
jgi:DNA-3-methyladenine glycosylase II